MCQLNLPDLLASLPYLLKNYTHLFNALRHCLLGPQDTSRSTYPKLNSLSFPSSLPTLLILSVMVPPVNQIRNLAGRLASPSFFILRLCSDCILLFLPPPRAYRRYWNANAYFSKTEIFPCQLVKSHSATLLMCPCVSHCSPSLQSP